MNQSSNGWVTSLSVTFFFVIFSASLSFAGTNDYEMPSKFDNSEKYLFFFHNYYVEQKGPDGDCKYYDLLEAFAENKFHVISEVDQQMSSFRIILKKPRKKSTKPSMQVFRQKILPLPVILRERSWFSGCQLNSITL